MSNQNYMVIFMGELHSKKYRYERKYIIEFNYLPRFLSNIYSLGFTKAYDHRNVNNIYIDDYDFSSLQYNFDGLSKRNKYRIRWYSDKFKKSNKNLEIKIKNEFLNYKQIYDLESLQLKSLEDVDFFFDSLKFKLQKQKNYELLNLIQKKRPTLLNSYKRMYFENKIQNLRLTIDDNLFFYSPITGIKFKEKFIIVEIKYQKNIEFINSLDKLRFTRYSKYVKGTSQTTFPRINY